MAEPVNGGSSNPPPPKEMSMEVRLLLAFVLMGLVVFLTPYFIKTTPPVRKTASATTSKPAAQTAASPAPAQPAPVPESSAAPATPEAAPVPGATPQQPQPPFVINTNLFRVVFSNQGATVRSWQLTQYKGADFKPLELTNTADGLEFPFSLRFPGQQPTSPVNWKYFQQTPIRMASA